MRARAPFALVATLAVTTSLALPADGAHAATGAVPIAGLHPGAESFFAPPPAMFLPSSGPIQIRRPACKPGQIQAVAFTQPSPDGVMGVIELKGTKIYHKKPWGKLRCSLPISKGPRGFVAANGEALDVGLGRANAINPAYDTFGTRYLAGGRAAWGFGWFGQYCGEAPRYVVMKLKGDLGLLDVPYDGPTPTCPDDPAAAVTSTLTDGPVGWTRGPVQPAPPSFLRLTTSARFLGTTTTDEPAGVEVTISNTSDQPVALVPCPTYSVQTRVSKGNRPQSGSGVIDNRTPGCKHASVTVQPGEPLTFQLTRREISPSTTFDAPSGSTFEVRVSLAGMPTAAVSTTVE